MSRARRFAALLVSLSAGCRAKTVDFPVGFFGVQTPADARLLAGLGFDAVQSYAATVADVAALSRAARENGQLLLVSPDAPMASGARARDFPGAVWYVADEPDLSGTTPAALAARDRAIKAWAPDAQTAFVVGDGRRAADYPGTADAIMVDWYPVPHLPLESAGDMVRLTAAAAGGRKVWAVLQAMDWRDFPQHDPKKKRIGRFPTSAEIRFMSYDAVLGGAQGVWYFTYSTSTATNLSGRPELLAAVVEPAGELRALAPVFARGSAGAPPFAASPNGPAARAWSYRGREYVILAARRTGVDVLFPPELLSSSWRPLFESRRDVREALRSYGGSWYLRSHRVIVLESRLAPGR